MKTNLKLIGTAAVVALMFSSSANAFLIDNFNDTQTVTQTGIGNTASNFGGLGGAVGASRELTATVTNGTGDLTIGANSPNAGQFTHSADAGVTGHSLLRWDGNADGVLGFGLVGVDLTDASASTGIALKLVSTDFPVNLTFRVYEDGSIFSTATVAAPPLSSNVNFFIDFASFTDTGTGANFADVKAIEFTINDLSLDADADLRIDFIQSTTNTVAEPATLAILGLGLIGAGYRRRKA
jgi:hypothetical protein